MIRSACGCWTCKLRHRKCDETPERCKLCVQHGVTCYGYGARPEWMDGGSKERSQAFRVKQQAKEARKLTKQVVATGSTPLSADRTLMPDPSIAPALSPPTSLAPDLCTFEEADLLIHFLDVILPLQFPYHTSHRRSVVKAWFFWLLIKNENEPFRDAALSLSALHRLRTGASSEAQTLEEYHSKALQKLQTVLQVRLAQSSACSCEELVELLAVGVCLISFEVFQDGLGNWHLHLRSLSAIVQVLEPKLLCDGGNESQIQPAIVGFVIGVVVWFDILSTASLRTAPQTNYRAWLGSHLLNMSELMGCDNWLLEIIGDIAALRCHASNGGLVSSISCQRIAEEIKERLHHGLQKLEKPADGTPLHLLVSQMFGYAAEVQLHTMMATSDTPSVEIDEAVTNSLAVMSDFPSSQTIRGLVWPLCVIGSMAASSQQHLFESFISRALANVQCDFGNCAATRRTIRTCWALRLLYPDEMWDWQKAMVAMDFNVLLV